MSPDMQEGTTINLSPPTPSSDSILPTQRTQLPPQPSLVPSLAPPSASLSSPLSVPSSPSLSVLSPMAYECTMEQIIYLLDRYGVSDEFIMNSQWPVDVFPSLIGLKHKEDKYLKLFPTFVYHLL